LSRRHLPAAAIDALLAGDSRFGVGFARDVVRVLADADERLLGRSVDNERPPAV